MKSILCGIASLLTAYGAVLAAPLGITVPAYFYPGALWEQLNAAAREVPLTAIMNPASGPQAGPGDIANYNLAVRALQAAGGRVIGYVSTRYGDRPLSEVIADIDLYLTQYTPLNGFFMDEMKQVPGAADLLYYQEIYRYIKTKNVVHQVTGNPGSYSGEIYLTSPPAADTLVTYENKVGYDTAVPPAWVFNYLARDFMHIPWNVATASQMEINVRLAKSRNTGQIYVTDDDGIIPGTSETNPWDTLPSFWLQEVQLVKALNAADALTQLTVTRTQAGSVDVQINGSPGAYELQVSDDLQQWTPLATSYTASGTLTVPDPASVNFPRRFYCVGQ
jgi:Spherulation-specific family 4